MAGATSTGKGDFGGTLLLIALTGSIALLPLISQSASRIVSEAQSAIVSDHVQEVLHAKSIEVTWNITRTPEYYETFHIAQGQAPFGQRQSSMAFPISRSFITLVPWPHCSYLLIGSQP